MTTDLRTKVLRAKHPKYVRTKKEVRVPLDPSEYEKLYEYAKERDLSLAAAVRILLKDVIT